MKILTLDTATEACSAALLINGEITSRYELAPRQHTHLLLPMVEELLAESGCSLSQLDAFGLSCGPGSFTGLRIATAAVQGLAFGADKPVVSISSLRVMAQRAYREYQATRVLAGFDARMGEVYWGVYQLSAEQIMTAYQADSLCAPGDAFVPGEGKWTGVGSAWGTYEEILSATAGKRLNQHDADFYPHAHDAATIAAVEFEQGHYSAADNVAPTYLRNRVAKKSVKQSAL